MNAQDEARMRENTSNIGTMTAAGGATVASVGAALCVGSAVVTAPLAGVGGVLGCPAGAALVIGGTVMAGLGGGVGFGAAITENKYIALGRDIRTQAIRSGCPASMF